jgi:hypothetical protein
MPNYEKNAMDQREGISIQSTIVSVPSSELAPTSSTPSPSARVCPPHLDPEEGTLSIAEERVGEANADKGTDTKVSL